MMRPIVRYLSLSALRTGWYCATLVILTFALMLPTVWPFDNGSQGLQPQPTLTEFDVQELVRNGILTQDEARERLSTIEAKRSGEGDVAQATYALLIAGGFAPYGATNEESGLYRLVSACTGVPYCVVLAPVLISCAVCCANLKRGSLLSHAPITAYAMGCGLAVSSIALSLGAVLVVTIPSFVVAAARNGVGSFEYPCVYLRADMAVPSTVGEVAVHCLALYICALLFLCVLCATLTVALQKPTVTAVIVGCMVAAPLVIEGSGLNGASMEVLAFLPSTYLSFADIAGTVSYTGGLVHRVPANASFGLGCMVLLAATAILFGVLGILSWMSLAQRKSAVGNDGLRTKNLTVGHAMQAPLVCDVALCAHLGEIVGLIAPNGAGKTTLLASLDASCGVRPLAGCVEVNGVPWGNTPLYRSQVFYAAEDEQLLNPRLSCCEHLALVEALWPHALASRDVLEAFGVADFARKPVRTLSQGMAQLVLLAVACGTGVRCILLDEPTNSLDLCNVAVTAAALRSRACHGAVIVISSHVLSVVDRVCDRVWYIVDRSVTEPCADARAMGLSAWEWYRRYYLAEVIEDEDAP